MSSAAHDVIAQLQQAKVQLETARAAAFRALQLLDKAEQSVLRAVGNTARGNRILSALKPRHTAIKNQILAINPLVAQIEAAIASIQGGNAAGGGKNPGGGAPPAGPA